MTTYYTASGETITLDLDSEIGQGGEGHVYLVKGINNTIAKIYTKEDEIRQKKVEYMATLYDEKVKDLYSLLAWPKRTLYKDCEGKQFAGFLMEHFASDEGQRAPTLVELHRYSTTDYWKMDTKLEIAQDLARSVKELHDELIVIGDFNPNNVICVQRNGTWRVAFLDVDSFCRIGKRGSYPCPVCLQGYYPPEVTKKLRDGSSGSSQSDGKFTVETDRYLLAVHIFQLLFNGCHPFHPGKVCEQGPDSVTRDARAAKGDALLFSQSEAPSFVPSFNAFPGYMKRLFRRAFIGRQKGQSADPKKRPTGEEWEKCLKRYRRETKKCKRGHAYWRRASSCPYCDADDRVSGRSPRSSANTTDSKKKNSGRKLITAAISVIIIAAMVVGLVTGGIQRIKGFSSDEAIKSLDNISEYGATLTYEEKLWYYDVATVRNDSPWTLQLTAYFQFQDASGNELETKDTTVYAVAPGETAVFAQESSYGDDVSKVEVEWGCSESSGTSVSKQLSAGDSFAADATLKRTVTNTSDETISPLVVFSFTHDANGHLIGLNYNYFEEGLTPHASVDIDCLGGVSNAEECAQEVVNGNYVNEVFLQSYEVEKRPDYTGGYIKYFNQPSLSDQVSLVSHHEGLLSDLEDSSSIYDSVATLRNDSNQTLRIVANFHTLDANGIAVDEKHCTVSAVSPGETAGFFAHFENAEDGSPVSVDWECWPTSDVSASASIGIDDIVASDGTISCQMSNNSETDVASIHTLLFVYDDSGSLVGLFRHWIPIGMAAGETKGVTLGSSFPESTCDNITNGTYHCEVYLDNYSSEE